MMKYLQRLGKSLMLPVACLPVAGIMLGLGYWIDPNGWGKDVKIRYLFLHIPTPSTINAEGLCLRHLLCLIRQISVLFDNNFYFSCFSLPNHL